MEKEIQNPCRRNLAESIEIGVDLLVGVSAASDPPDRMFSRQEDYSCYLKMFFPVGNAKD